MTKVIVVAGAAGNLGKRIARELRQRQVTVRALVRPGTKAERLVDLLSQGVKVVPVDFGDAPGLARACEGAACVVSTLLGVEQTMIGTQGQLLDASIQAGVPRFIPSDFAMDFMKVAPGLNRNFDLHRRFQQRLDDAPIRSTAILNGCFMELLKGEAPLILTKLKRVLYWGKDPNQALDFTTMENTAAYTAQAALDDDTPRFLRIAGAKLSALQLAEVAGLVSGHHYGTLRGGRLGRLQTIISIVRKLTPASDAPFPVWQGMQYLYCMFEGSGELQPLDNDRYPMQWTGIAEFLR